MLRRPVAAAPPRPHRALRLPLALLILVPACGEGAGLAPAPYDAAAGAHDLGVPDGRPPDLRDAGPGDAAFCRGGYLNSSDPKACPLGCSPLVEPVADEGDAHEDFCTPIKYRHDPPASGNHWPWEASWGPHQGIVPREWWVHNLEHQGIVLLYNCPYPKGAPPKMAPVEGTGACLADGGASYPAQLPAVDDCATEIAELVKLYAAHPVENFYDALFETRILVTQDPFLPGRFGAVAWDWSYVSDQLDTAALRCFIDARYGRGPEPAP